MGAFFYNFSGKGIIKTTVPGQLALPITIANQSWLFSDTYILVDSVAVTTTETIQYTLTFDDFIHFYHFGKGLGSFTLSGVLLAGEDGTISKLANFYNMANDIRGKETILSVGNMAFAGVLNDTNVAIVAEPETMANFTINMGVINSSFSSPQSGGITCRAPAPQETGGGGGDAPTGGGEPGTGDGSSSSGGGGDGVPNEELPSTIFTGAGSATPNSYIDELGSLNWIPEYGR